ncbi:hypothetical protein ACRRTK_002707 [Alexandromys fortis]
MEKPIEADMKQCPCTKQNLVAQAAEKARVVSLVIYGDIVCAFSHTSGHFPKARPKKLISQLEEQESQEIHEEDEEARGHFWCKPFQSETLL